MRQWGPRGSPASAGSPGRGGAPQGDFLRAQRNERAFALKAKREIWSLRQWGPRGSPASAGSPGRGGAPQGDFLRAQRNERAFALKAKREIWSLRRRGHITPQNGQITFQTFPGKWGKMATAGRGSPRGEAERKVLWALGAGRSTASGKQERSACILLPKLRQSPDRVSPEREQSPHMVLAEFPQSLCRACAEFAQSFTKVCWKLGQVC
mgnify:CR=1 FL=1